MVRSRRLAALRSSLHLPRTVRLRLTLLYGAVALVSCGVLLAITFLGSNKSTSGFFVGCTGSVNSPSPSSCVVRHTAGTVPPPGQGGSVSGSVSIVSGHSAGGGTLTISEAERAGAQIASSGTVHDLLVWSLVGLATVTVVALALGWLMSGRMLRPLRTIRNTARHISEENLHERLALPGPSGDELKELGDTIDGLLARLEAAFEAQGRFVQNASHELRTPITMMRTSLEVATGKPRGATPEVAALASKLEEGLDQAERLVESFLVLARVQSEQVTDHDAVRLSETVAAALATYREEVERLGLTVQSELGEAVAFGSETLLARVVANLVGNAVRHNEPGGWLRVATGTDGGRVRLVVENGGLHLDQDWVARLGQPFQRLVADRTASDRGVGLGLSIVAAIVQSEGGKLAIHGRDSGGLRVTVELPAARSLLGTGGP